MTFHIEQKRRSQLSEPPVFDSVHYDRLNASREAVVKELLPRLKEKDELRTAVDVGCGLGFFSALLHTLGFQVTAVDGREENATEGRKRYPGINFVTGNAEHLSPLGLGTFDLVLCFGLLYHLENPFAAIRNLHSLTGKVLLVESMCAPGIDSSMQLLDEAAVRDQGLTYVAFYPTEPCLVKMLYRAGFPFVYGLTHPPDHADFHATNWRRKARTMLVASRDRLNATGLVLLQEPYRPWDIWSVIRTWRFRLGRLVRKFRPPVRSHTQEAGRI
jgi:tRNA (mo5U34)-methyltransferase